MIKLPEPLGYLCDWGDDRYGLPNQIVYYDGPGSAIEDDWNEHPEVHLNTPIHTESQLKQAVRDFGEHLAKHFGSMPGREMFGGEIEDEIRVLIKEIPE